MSMMYIGDRVMATCTIDGNQLEGQYGTIVAVHPSALNCGVQFDNEILGGHDCDGNGEYGYCWYCDEASLMVIETDTVEYEASNELLDFLCSFASSKSN